MAKEIHKRISVWLNQQGIENNLKSVRAAINKTANELAKLPIGTEEWYRKSEKLKKLKDIQVELQKEIKTTSAEIEKHNRKLNNTIVNIGAIASAYTGASTAIRRILSAIQEYVEAYASLDDAMTNVSKYTGLTREEVKQLNEEFQKMDTRTPTEKLNALAADAGRLGITSKEAIKDFVEAADIINVALGEDLGEDAVKEIGKLAEMFGTTETMGLRGAMLATGSAINTLAQSSSASERYLMDFTSRLAGAANQAQISQANILGFASVLDQNKQQVEMSATALQKLLMNMFTAPEKYAHLAGMSVKEFADALKNDANEALITFLDTLNKKGGLSELAPIFKDLGLDGARASGVISVLAGKIDDVREAQATANAAFAEGNSVIKEAAAVNGNAAAQLDKAKKAVQDAKAALGEELLPVITDLTKSSASGLKVLTAVVKFWTQHKALLLALAGAYGALRLAQKAVIANQKEEQALTLANTVAGKAYTLVTKLLAVAKAKLAADTEAAAAAQAELKAAFATTPWGAIIVAVATLATSIGMLISKHRDAKKAAEEFNTECAREQAEAEYLFDKLKKAEKGTKDYEDALQELKEKYPEIIQKHLDEEGALRDVEQAYKDVIVQIKAKIAEQLKEQQITKATEDALGKQQKALDGIRQQIVKQGKSESLANRIAGEIKQMMDAGDNYADIIKYVKQQGLDLFEGQGVFSDKSISKHINNYLAAEAGLKKANEDAARSFDPFIKASNEEVQIQEQLNELYKSKERMSGTIFEKGIDDQIDALLDKLAKVQEAKKTVAEEPAGSNSTGNGGSISSASDTDKNLKNKQANFQKDLASFMEKQRIAQLSEWEKTKSQIEEQYRQMLDRAKEAYVEGSAAYNEVVRQLNESKAQTLTDALGKYLKTLTDASDKMMAEAKKMLDESNPDNKETPLIKAVFGEQQKWEEKMQAVRANIANLDEIIDTMEPGDEGWDDLLSTRQTLFEQLLTLQQDNAQAISNVIRQHTQSDTDFIKDKEEKLARARMSDHDRQVAEINELYNTKIEAKRKEIAALEKLLKENPENADIAKQIEELKKLIEQLEKLQGKEISAVPQSGGQKSIWQQLAEFDWSKLKDNWQEALSLMTQGLQEFANTAFDIYNSIAQIQDNMMEAELQKAQETYDAKSAALQKQLNSGVISQKYYDAKMAKLQEEKEKKEKKLKHEQFERDKTASIIQAIINGALAISNVWSTNAGMPILAAVLTAVTAATTALQVAAIASQPNPYAKGSYIRGPQIALMGEEGDEWVASNRLLRDKRTAGIIEALDQYQKGNRAALAGIKFNAPDTKIMSHAGTDAGRTFAPSNTTNNYYQNSDNGELLKEIRMLRKYMEDPRNRQATINRNILLEYERLENSVKEMARL